MKKIFTTKHIKIYTWIAVILALFLFELGYCNNTFTKNLLKGEITTFFFSLARGVIYLAVLVATYFLTNRTKITEEIAKTYETKGKQILTLIYVILAILLTIWYIYRYMTTENVIGIVHLAALGMTMLTGFMATLYLSKNYITNLIALAMIGMVFCMTVANYHSLDEKKHFMSAYNISYGNVDFTNPKVDTIFMTELSRGTEMKDFTRFFEIPYEYKQGTLPEENTVDSMPASYSPIIYTPGAIGILLGRILRGSAGDVFLLGRLANLFAYFALMILTLKVLPFKKNLFYTLLTIPVFLCFAGTYSIDGLGIGLVSLFIAYCLKLHHEKDKIAWKNIMILTAIYVLSLTYKTMSYAFIGMLIFILPLKDIIKQYKKRIPLLIVGFLLAVFLLLITQPKVELSDNRFENVNAKEQAIFLMKNPLKFVDVIKCHTQFSLLNPQWLRDLIPADFLSETVASLVIPLYAYLFYIGISDDSKNFGKKEKGIFLATFAMNFIFTSAILYLSCTAVGWFTVGGYQLRYIFPTMILLLLCASSKKLKKVDNKQEWLMIGMVPIMINVLAVIGTI